MYTTAAAQFRSHSLINAADRLTGGDADVEDLSVGRAVAVASPAGESGCEIGRGEFVRGQTVRCRQQKRTVIAPCAGGLGVREWVLWTALGASIDRDLAVVAALTLRLVWFVGEAVASASIFAIRPPVTATLAPDTRLSEL